MENLVDCMKEEIKKHPNYAFISVIPSGMNRGKNLGLMVAHKEMPVNDNGILVSDHSKFIEMVEIKDKDPTAFQGIILDKSGSSIEFPKEESVACKTCSIQTPKQLVSKDGECYACQNLTASLENFNKAQAAAAAK